MAEQNCTLFPDAPEKCTALSAVKKTMGSFSIVGSLFIIVVIVLFRKYRYFEQRLILYLSISAFFRAIGYTMGDVYPEHDRSKACVFEAWWLTFFGHSVLAWVSCITCNLYFSTVRKADTTKFEKYYIPIAWGIPIIVACLPLFGNHYGPAGMWCWIRRDTENAMVWRFTTWYVPLFAIILTMFVVYAYIFFVLRRQVKAWEGLYSAEAEESKELMNKHIKPLRFYPFIYLALSVFPLIHRIQNAVTTESNFTLLLLHTMSNPLVGFANGIVFGMDRATLSRLNYVQIKSALLSWISPSKPLVNEYPLQPAEETPGREPSCLPSVSSAAANTKDDVPPLPSYSSNPAENLQGSSPAQGSGAGFSSNTLDDEPPADNLNSEAILQSGSPLPRRSSETGNEKEPHVSNGTNFTATRSTEFEDVSLE